MSDSDGSISGIGFFGLLTIAFIVLKLTKTIAWSWFWVLSPVIFPLILALCLVILILIVDKKEDR